MAYAALDFPSLSDMRPASDEQHEMDDTTMRAVVHQECDLLFGMLAKIITSYATTKQEQKLRVFFEMVEDGLNEAINILTQGYQGEEALNSNARNSQ